MAMTRAYLPQEGNPQNTLTWLRKVEDTKVTINLTWVDTGLMIVVIV